MVLQRNDGPCSKTTMATLLGMALGLVALPLAKCVWTTAISLYTPVPLYTVGPAAVPTLYNTPGMSPLFAAKRQKGGGGGGFGTPAKATKKPPLRKSKKPVDSFLSIDDEPESNMPIEKLQTTIFDAFTPPKDMGEELDPGLVAGLEVLKYPHPLLRAPNEEITEEELLSGQVETLARKMFKMMYETNGIGLAAPQLGINKRMMVYNPQGDPQMSDLEQVLVNPEIVAFSDRIIDAPEGCLSFPTVPKTIFQKAKPFEGTVWRPDAVTVSALNLKGQRNVFVFKGWAARIFMHEYDHLDGILWIDRLTPSERERLKGPIDDLIKKHGPGGVLLPTVPVKVWENPNPEPDAVPLVAP